MLVHMFFLLFAALGLYLLWTNGDVWIGVLFVIVLLCSVFLHELGHCAAAVRLGGRVDQIIVGPLGGLAPAHVSHDARSELLAVAAGPAVNIGLCLVCLGGLTTIGAENIVGLLNPFSPEAVWQKQNPHEADLSVNFALRLVFWINWLVFAANLIPAFPFDGGRALRAAFSIFPPTSGRRRPVLLVASFAKFFSVGLLVVAWLVRDSNADSVVPTWFPLVLLAIFLFFSARAEENQLANEEADGELFGYDFSKGYTSLDVAADEPAASARGPIAEWLHRQREKKRRRQQAVEADEDRRVDEILARLHEIGMENLSPEERALLNRASARYRSRERS